MKKYSFKIIALGLISGTVLLSSCASDPREPGRIFMPDMTYSQAYETYTDNPNFDNGLTAQKPVEGTIPRGVLPEQLNASDSMDQEALHKSYLADKYYDETPQSKTAMEGLKNPVAYSKEVLKEGEALYQIHCQVCHGEEGKGQGTIVQSGAYPVVPSYEERMYTADGAIKPQGSLYHTLTFGLNLMGSYASQMSPEERWKVIYYIQDLSGIDVEAEYGGDTDGTASASANAGAATMDTTATDTETADDLSADDGAASHAEEDAH